MFKAWADYLVTYSLTPAGLCDSQCSSLDLHAQWNLSSITADGLNNPNMTNLAIKGIIGISAMSAVSGAIGNMEDQQFYSVIHQSL